MSDILDTKIENLERYIIDIASVSAIDKLLKEIKGDVASSSLQDKQNYQRLLNIIDVLLSRMYALKAELEKKDKTSELKYFNKDKS